MAKKRTPSPEPEELATERGCIFAAVAVAVVAGVVAAMLSWGWLYIACVPGVLALGYVLHTKWLLFRAQRKFGARGIAGVLVTSDSPNWQTYIEEHWIAEFGDRFVVLNWSQRKSWSASLEERLFYRFGKYEENYCPCIILLRGLRPPLVFRFFLAFRDHKHGNEAALYTLKKRLREELESRVVERPPC